MDARERRQRVEYVTKMAAQGFLVEPSPDRVADQDGDDQESPGAPPASPHGSPVTRPSRDRRTA